MIARYVVAMAFVYEWRGDFDNADVNALHAEGFEHKVLDDDWQVAALHKKWTYVNNVTFQGKTAGWVNEGTQISAILADLQSNPALLAQIA